MANKSVIKTFGRRLELSKNKMTQLTPQQSYKKIEKASSTLIVLWLLNNILGGVGIIISIYLVWWVWHLGFFGVVVLIVMSLIINSVILPFIFNKINKTFDELAMEGKIELAEVRILDNVTIVKLANAKVEQWPKVIIQNITEENLKKIFPKYEK